MKILPNGIAVLENDSHLSKWIEEQGRLAVDGTARTLAERFIKPGDAVVDGGASLGDHTTVYLDAAGPSGTVYAFEPNPDAFECLRHNCQNAIASPFALGQKGTGKLMRDGPGNLNFGSSFIQTGEGEIVVVPLDFYDLSRLSFIKLDIEGMEFDALCGAVETLKRCRPVVMAEINRGCMARRGVTYEMIDSLMASLGYRMELLDANYGLECAQTDVLFIPQ